MLPQNSSFQLFIYVHYLLYATLVVYAAFVWAMLFKLQCRYIVEQF